ncbi:retrovirus-related pol polyprotein from transposon TNT 1-94 [Tanacetum coccineum]
MSDTVPPIPPPFGANTVQNVVDENLPQLLDSRLRSLLNDLENNGVSIPQAEVNATFVNILPRKWLSINQTQRANNSIKNDTLAALYGKYNYEEGLESDFNIEEDQRSSSEFLADLNVEFHERALLANQKRFYKRSRRVGFQKKPMDKTNETCFACGKLGHFQKEFKYKGLKAEIAVLTKKIDAMNKGMSAKGLVVESFDWDEESASSDDEGITTFKALMVVADEPSVGRADASEQVPGNIVMALEGTGKRKEKGSSKDIIFTKSDVSTYETNPELPSDLESDDNTQIPLPSLPKLIGAEPSGVTKTETKPTPDSSTEKLLLTLMKEVKGLKEQIQTHSETSPPTSQSGSSRSAKGKDKIWYGPRKYCGLKNHLPEDCYEKPKCSTCGSSDHLTKEHPDQIVVKRTLAKLHTQLSHGSSRKAPMIPKPYIHCKYCGFNDHHSNECEFYPGCDLCGSIAHETSDCPKKTSQRKPRIALKQSSEPTAKYSKESGPKVVFGDNSSGDTEGYSLVNYNGITFTKVAYVNGLKHNLISISQLCDTNFKVLFTKTQGTIFNQNQEVVLIAPRRRDVYVIDMTSYNEESNSCSFAKASPSVNWLWHKRLSYLNFKNINKLAKENLVAGLPSLTFSKDKTCSACEKRKHHRASFKTKRSFSINKCLYLLHMDLYTWVFYLKKKSDAADCIISFIRKMENLNEVNVKELRSDNGTKFKNYKLEEFCDENGISQNFSSPCTPEQNGVAERRNITLIEATRTMLNSANLPKQFWGEAVNTACYTQNRSIIVKRHEKTAYDVFRGRSPDINNFYVFGCPVHIHNHKDHLGKFDKKADDGFFLGYSPMAKAFRISTEGDAINFNEIRSFPDDEFQEPRRKTTQEASNNKHLPYVSAYDPLSSNNINIPKNLTSANSHHAQDSIEPKRLIKALEEEGWIIAMYEELNQFERNKVWTLVPLPNRKTIIGTKWIYRNKMDEHGIVIKNKAKLVAQGLKAIIIFLAYAAYMGFMVYQIDMKSAFLNGKISEEVYVQQPPGFKSSEFPNHVCKLDKALYGLIQAPRACASVKCPMLSANNLGPDESGVFINETVFRGMIRYQANPKESHLVAVQRIFRKSTSGGCQILGGKLVCWSAKKQNSVAMSSAEAEYVPIFCDNTSAIAISNNPVLHSRTKHIDTKYHFIRDHILKCDIELHFVPTDLQLADIFTKPLAKPSFTRLVAELGMLNITSEVSDKKKALNDDLN